MKKNYFFSIRIEYTKYGVKDAVYGVYATSAYNAEHLLKQKMFRKIRNGEITHFYYEAK